MCDDIALMMYIAEIVAKEKLNGNVQIQLVSDEEKGAEFGTKHIIELIKKGKIKKPDCVIIGERKDSYEILNTLYGTANITPKDFSCVKTFFEVIKYVLKTEPDFYVGEGGVTDARFYRYTNRPTIIYAHLGEHANGPNEYVDVDSLEKQVNVYLGLINNNFTDRG